MENAFGEATRQSGNTGVRLLQLLEVAHPPAYLELEADARSVRVRELPEREQIPIQCETSLVIEFYSR